MAAEQDMGRRKGEGSSMLVRTHGKVRRGRGRKGGGKKEVPAANSGEKNNLARGFVGRDADSKVVNIKVGEKQPPHPQPNQKYFGE